MNFQKLQKNDSKLEKVSGVRSKSVLTLNQKKQSRPQELAAFLRHEAQRDGASSREFLATRGPSLTVCLLLLVQRLPSTQNKMVNKMEKGERREYKKVMYLRYLPA